jgi:hypothetical protein
MNRVLWQSVLLALVVTIAGASACTSLLGNFEVGTGGSGGATGSGGTAGSGGTTTSVGGAGGTTTTTTAMTSSGGTGGTGGTTTTTGGCETQECCQAIDCPATGSECLLPTCTDGTCGTQGAPPGTVVSRQTPNDCQQIECDGQGAAVAVALDADLMDDALECTADSCLDGAPVHTNVTVGLPCPTTANKYCDGKGACVECTEASHCSSAVCGADGTCLAPTCNDMVKNGGETDLDCGGPCNGCDTGQVCAIAGDCFHGICGAGGTCVAPACNDGVQNGGDHLGSNGETDVDCGGPCGATCGPMQGCAVNEDCVGAQCSGSLCIPNCADGVQNNTESAVDCGGTCNGCDNGETCAAGADCTSTFCTDGVCCNTACGAECRACTATLKGGGIDGVCGAIAGGTDPDDECDPEAAGTCGNSTGLCSGAIGCAQYAAGSLCGSGPACAMGAQTNQDTCSGTGTCNDNGTTPCGLYACGASACNTTCSSAADCVATAYCPAGACVLKKPLGAACAGAGECTNGICSDGICCNALCGGTCEACNLAGSVGTCTPIPAGTDPGDADCAGATQVCNGAGACKTVNGSACVMAGACLSGFCADGVCCNSTCGTLCQACTSAKTAAANGTCANVSTGTDPDLECVGVTNCNGAGACTKLANGAVCTLNAECNSTFCVDGVCCGTVCNTTCMACSAAKKGAGPDGTCGNVATNTDPDNECATECNGAGLCEVANGSACTLGSQCQSGSCTDGVCCSAACGGLCQACTLAKTGVATGTCASIVNATDPDNECLGATSCNGAGACTKLANGTACTLPAECNSTFCADGVCCGNACTFTCMACTLAKTGQASGTCANVATGTDPDVECVGATNCNGVGQCGLFANGAACTVAGECTSNSCVDGVCCNAACGGLCQACTMAKTGVASGTCSSVVAGTDPDNECSGATPNCAMGGACGP